jgi:hypothetical protein
MNLHMAIEKDKTNMCLQGEGNFSVIHNVPPFGSRHITQVGERGWCVCDCAGGRGDVCASLWEQAHFTGGGERGRG